MAQVVASMKLQVQAPVCHPKKKRKGRKKKEERLLEDNNFSKW
jgi:hypothetical protein